LQRPGQVFTRSVLLDTVWGGSPEVYANALILLLFGAIVVLSFHHQVTAQQNKLLDQQVASLAKSLAAGPVYRSDESARILADPEKYAWVILTPDGSVVDRGPMASSLGLPYPRLARKCLQEQGVVSEAVEGPAGEIRVASSPVAQPQNLVVLQVARSPQVVWEIVASLVLVLVPVGLGALALAAAGGLFMSRRAMRPVQDAFDRQRTFIADASHELKTPLTLIRADAEVLSPALADPDDRELADDLIAETDRMNALLSDLLTLARLDAGQLAVEHKPFDLANTIAETVDRFDARASAEARRLEIRLDTPDGELPARGDARRTEQILAALLDNALRFTPPGGCVTVEGRIRDGQALATVTDTGPGVAPEHLARVFDRFYRGEGARTRSEAGGGTGLGLSIARDLARAQNGDLTAANSPEGGALFTLALPAAS
jgi:signal transduction histidine kinase